MPSVIQPLPPKCTIRPPPITPSLVSVWTPIKWPMSIRPATIVRSPFNVLPPWQPIRQPLSASKTISRISTIFLLRPCCSPITIRSTVRCCLGWTLFSSKWDCQRVMRNAGRNWCARCIPVQPSTRRTAIWCRRSWAGNWFGFSVIERFLCINHCNIIGYTISLTEKGKINSQIIPITCTANQIMQIYRYSSDVCPINLNRDRSKSYRTIQTRSGYE